MALELTQLESNVRRAYERGRVAHAVRVTAPLLALGAFVLLLDGRPAVMLGLGALLFVTEALFVWRGQQLGRGALAGLVGGVIPLTFGLCMQVYGRFCGGLPMMAGCTAVCGTGGLLAGLWIAWLARRQTTPSSFVFAAGASALLVGAIGCACAGAGGFAGLLGGLFLPVLATRAHASLARV